MKKRKIAKAAVAVLSIMAISAGGAALAACKDKHSHSYDGKEWEIKDEPALETGGTAGRDCVKGDYTDIMNVPKLNDASFWTETTKPEDAPTHTSDGSRSFENTEFGLSVTITVLSPGHDKDSWQITKDPTMTETGKAKYTCTADGYVSAEMDIPALSDSAVWTEVESKHKAPTHTAAGEAYYTSIYGEVKHTIPASADAHEYGEWTITKDPTLKNPGKASHTCEAPETHAEAYTEIIDIPELSNGSVWTEITEKRINPTHTQDGEAYYTSIYGEVKIVLEADANAHEYGVWTFVEGEKPTWNNPGRIQHTCDSPSHEEPYTAYEEVPALSDSFWTKINESVAPTHQEGGVADFRNAEYRLTVFDAEIPKAEHTFGDWVITQAPTLSDSGEATHTCTVSGCSSDPTATETTVVPALSDASWTLESTTTADINHAATATYVHADFGPVTIVTSAKLPAPYDSKVYATINFEISNGKLSVGTSWTAARLTVGDDGSATGSGYPFNGGPYTLEIIDLETGELNFSSASTTYGAYVDLVSGIFVMQRSSGSWSDVHVAVPTEVSLDGDDFESLLADNDMVISYVGGVAPVDMIVNEDGVLFGVTFEDLVGNAMSMADAFNLSENANNTVVVKDSEGNAIKTYGYNGEKWISETDGLEGIYTLDSDTEVLVNGVGTVTVKNSAGVIGSGEYTVVSENVIGAIIGGVYSEYTLNSDDTCTVAQPKVNITLNFNDTLPTGQSDMTITMESLSKSVPVVLATDFEHATMLFMGWFKDAACSQPVALVDGKYVPTETCELFAKWATKVVLNLQGVINGDSEEIVVGVEDEAEILFSDILPAYVSDATVDRINGKLFKGWFTDSVDGDSLNVNAVVSAEDNGKVIVAKWEDNVSRVYGSYYAMNITGRSSNGNPSRYSSGDKTITVDKTGAWLESGSSKGTVSNFDAATGIFTIGTAPAAIDVKTGVMVYNYKYAVNSGNIQADKYIAIPNATKADLTSNQGSYWNSGLTVVAEFNVNNGESTMLVFVHNNRVWGNISYTSTDGQVDVNKIHQANQVTIYDCDGEIIVSFIKDNNKLVPADKYMGTYKVADGDDLVLNGLGNVTLGERVGSYTAADAEAGYTLDVYLDNESEYLQVALNMADKTYTVERPEVTITFDSDYGEVANDEHANINVVYALPKPTSTQTQIFRGWYFEDNTAVPEGWKPSEDITLHAKWEVKVTLTVYNFTPDAEDPEIFEYAEGEEAVLNPGEFETSCFEGWYNEADFATEYEGGAIESDTIIYGKWVAAPAYYKEYKSYYHTYTFNTDGATAGGTVKFGADGVTTSKSGNYPFGSNNSYPLTISDYSEDSNEFVLDYYQNDISSWHYYERGYIDKATGIILLSFNSKTSYDAVKDVALDLTKFIILVPNKGTVEVQASTWNSGKYRVITAKFNDEIHNIFIDSTDEGASKVHFGVSFKDNAESGEDVPAQNGYKAEMLYVLSSSNEILYKGAYVGSNMVEYDGFEDIAYVSDGSDELNLGDLSVDGISAITLGETGTYTIVDKAAGTIAAYVGDSYYEITLNKAAQTYTLVKPMVTVTFESVHGTYEQTVQANKNIAITLPALEEENNVFRGWYVQGNESKLYVGGTEFIATEDVTLVAKWDESVKLIVVYGKDLPNAEIMYGKGDTPTLPVEPPYTNGEAFDYWYLSSDGGETEDSKYTAAAINEDTTIYAKWKVVVPMYGKYAGFETWGSSSGTIYGGTSAKNLTVSADGSTTGVQDGSLEQEYDPATGYFKIKSGSSTYLAYFDAENGIIAGLYTSGGTSLGYDYYVLFRGATSATTSSLYSSHWNGGYTRLLNVTVNGWKQKQINVFIYENKLYANVSWTSTDGEVAAQNAYKANQISIFDSNRDLIVEFVKDGSKGLVPVASYVGEYTGNLLGFDESVTLTVDGNGNVQIGDGATVPYTINKNEITFVYGNRMYVVALLEGTFTQIEDGTGGYLGSYTGSLAGVTGTVTLKFNGVGKVQIGDDSKVTYKLVDEKIAFVYDNRTYVITLSDTTFTQVEDGYAGTYALPEEDPLGDEITLDGFGSAGDGKTYAVNGTKITVYHDGGFTTYGIDVEGNELLAMSVVAGMKFKRDTYLYVEFDDDAELSGKFQLEFSFYITFSSGSYDASSNKLTLTVSGGLGNFANAGDTLVFVYDAANGKLIIKLSECSLTSTNSINQCSDNAEFALV